MDKYLVPGAIVVSAIILAVTFRYEVQPVSAETVFVRDRWSGEVKSCERVYGKRATFCVRYLSAGLKPVPKVGTDD